jgi:hypothetical protein
MTNFIWNVTQLYTETIEGKEDYVVLANCETIGVDGEYTASVPNVIQFSTEEVGTFIPYADLTEEIVIGWIKEVLGEDGVLSSCFTLQENQAIIQALEKNKLYK